MIGNTADLIAYAAARGMVIDAAEAPMLLQSATDYLNGFKWIGEVADPVQEDSWPRIDFYSLGGAYITADNSVAAIPAGDYVMDAVTPRSVVNAAYMLAMTATTVDLNPVTGLAQTTRETVGPITLEYAEGSLGGAPSFPWWQSQVGAFLVEEFTFAGNFNVYRG